MKPLILFLQRVFCNWTTLILYFQKVHVKGVNTYWHILQNLPILEPRQPVARGKKTYCNWPLNTYTNIDLPVGIWNTAKYLSICSYYAGFSKTSRNFLQKFSSADQCLFCQKTYTYKSVNTDLLYCFSRRILKIVM